RVATPRWSFSSWMFSNIFIRASWAAGRRLQAAGRSALACSLPPEACSRLHPEYAEAGRLDGRVERGGQGQGEHLAGLRRVDHAVVPQPRAGVVGVPLALVLGEDRRLDLRLVLGA